MAIVIDARTKWPEVFQLNEATSGTTITALMTTFSRFGLPEIIVTDNGSQFTSDQFKTFCDEYQTCESGALPSKLKW